MRKRRKGANKYMRAIFMGTNEFSVPTLKALIKSDIELLCVITQPDRPSGRKMKLRPSPVKVVALENDLPLHQPERVRKKEFVEEVLKPLAPDVIVVVAFGQILPESILNLPPIGCINLHPSLLPKYRGAAPIQRAIMNGENETGITVMFLDVGEDTGDIIIQEETPIGISDTSEDMFLKLSEIGAQLIIKTLKMAQGKPIPRQVQDDSKVTYAPKLSREDGLINWNKNAFEIHNVIRGTIPWPGAYIAFGDGERLKIWESSLLELSEDASPGTIIDIIPNEGIIVAAGDTGLLVKNVQPANKPRMLASAFANGYRLKKGDAFLNK